MATKNKHQVRVGIFIFIGLVLFASVVLAIGNINKVFTKTVLVTVVFDNVHGLQPGNNIWFSGVKIGTVKEFNFYENGEVEVTLKIEESSRKYVHKNSTAKIGSDGLIGNKIIVISGGTPDAPPIENGDVLKMEETTSNEQMLNMLQANNENILALTSNLKLISQRIADGEGSLGKLFTDTTMYDQITLSLSTLRNAAENAEQLTSSIAEFSAKFNQPGNFANDLATDTVIFNKLRSSVTELNAITTSAKAFMKDLETASDNLNNNPNSPAGVLLHDAKAAESMRSTIYNLEETVNKMNATLDALQHSFLLRGYFKKQEKEN